MARTTDELIAHSAWLRSISATLRTEAVYACRRVAQPRTPAAEVPRPATLAVVEETLPVDPHDTAMDALRQVREIIDAFPLEWQVAIVKALTARTMLKARERMQPVQAVISA